MKLTDARSAYYEHSGAASSIARKAAYAGIAVVWVFNAPSGNSLVAVPSQLRVVALLLVICLALDLLQYICATIIWGRFAHILERRMHRSNSTCDEMDAPTYLNWPSLLCFWGKLMALLVSYVYLATFIATGLSA